MTNAAGFYCLENEPLSRYPEEACPEALSSLMARRHARLDTNPAR
jgi:hypothetical protein